MKKPILIDNVEKGTSESEHYGFQSMVGVDVYSRKGIVRMGHTTLAQSTPYDNGAITSLPVCFEKTPSGRVYAQLADGSVIVSVNGGLSWSSVFEITGGTTPGTASGLIHYNGNASVDGYLFVFRQTAIGCYNIAANTYKADWQTGILASDISLSNITAGTFHFPFLFPNQSRVYFANRNKLGYIGMGTSATFNPAGTIATDYAYTNAILTLPGNYIINTLAFYPPSKLAMGCCDYGNNSNADLITWDTITTNQFDAPIRLQSNSQPGQGGIIQMVNRNNMLYCVTGGGHKIFVTNGSTYSELIDISLYTNLRLQGAMQTNSLSMPGSDSTIQSVLCGYPFALDIVNGRLITGISAPYSTSQYPNSYGIYPAGVWGITLEGDPMIYQTQNKNAVCEYVPYYENLSTASYFTPGIIFAIGALKTMGFNSYLVGWKKSTTYGISLVDPYLYLSDRDSGAFYRAGAILETPLIQIGTNLRPETISNFEIQFANKLTGQSFSIFYRNQSTDAYTLLQTISSVNESSYSITASSIGAQQFIQFAIVFYKPSNIKDSIEFKSILLT